MKKTYYIFPLLLIFFICTGRIYGDSFRVRKTVEVEVPPSGTVVCSAGIYDALAIKLPKDTTFLQGIELEIKIPEVISRYRGSVAYSLYTDVTPVPTKKTIDYTGTQQYLDVIPSKLSMILTIPLIEYDKSKDFYLSMTVVNDYISLNNVYWETETPLEITEFEDGRVIRCD